MVRRPLVSLAMLAALAAASFVAAPAAGAQNEAAGGMLRTYLQNIAMQQLAATQGQLAGALGRLNVAVEAYPDLKASQNMMQLSEELTSTENRVAFARQAYNDSVMTYNNRRQAFPGSVIAGTFHFDAAAQWEIAPDKPETREAPKVQF